MECESPRSKRIDALGRLRGTEGILRAAESEEDLFKAEFFPGLDVPDKVRGRSAVSASLSWGLVPTRTAFGLHPERYMQLPVY